MRQFLVERYLSRVSPDAAATAAESDKTAADQAARSASPVEHVSTLYLPEDETCLSLFRAPTPDAVTNALHAAGINAARMEEVIDPNRAD